MLLNSRLRVHQTMTAWALFKWGFIDNDQILPVCLSLWHTFSVFSNEKSNWECFLNEIWYIGGWLSCLKWKDTSFSFFLFKMWRKLQIKSHIKDASNTYIGWKLQVSLSFCLPLQPHRHLLNYIDTSFILIDICVHIYVHICVQIQHFMFKWGCPYCGYLWGMLFLCKALLEPYHVSLEDTGCCALLCTTIPPYEQALLSACLRNLNATR